MDLSLTANGRIRSHAADGKRVTPDNPACPGGSDMPRDGAQAPADGPPAEAACTAPGCGFSYPLAEDGTLRKHLSRITDGAQCPGSGRPPGYIPTPGAVRNAMGLVSSPCPDVADVAEEIIERADRYGVDVRRDPDAPPQPSPSEADLFLNAGDPEPEAPAWFPARYDGDCDTCGTDFDEGEMIRKAPDGWEAEACCGPDAAPGDRPVRVFKAKVAISNGRYVLPHPVTGNRWSASRVTTFVKLASDHYSLKQWELRSALVGMATDRDVFSAARSLVKESEAAGDPPSALVKKQRVALNRLADRAKSAARADERAHKGTRSHKFAEELDAGTRDLASVPDEYRRDLAAYREVTAAAGYTPLPHLIERTTAVPDFGTVGTFDRVMRGPDGKYVIFDEKSGKIEYGQDEIASQLAVYARGCNEAGVAEFAGDPDTYDHEAPDAWKSWRWAPLTDEHGNRITVEQDYGIVAHVPYGQGQCTLHRVPLAKGRTGAGLCAAVRDWQKGGGCFSPVPVPDPETPLPSGLLPREREAASAPVRSPQPAPDPDPPFIPADPVAPPWDGGATYEHWFAHVEDKAHARALWAQAKDDPEVDADRLKRLIAIADTALKYDRDRSGT